MNDYILPGDVVSVAHPDWLGLGKYVKAIPEGAVIKTDKGLVAMAHGLYVLERHVEQEEQLPKGN